MTSDNKWKNSYYGIGSSFHAQLMCHYPQASGTTAASAPPASSSEAETQTAQTSSCAPDDGRVRIQPVARELHHVQ